MDTKPCQQNIEGSSTSCSCGVRFSPSSWASSSPLFLSPSLSLRCKRKRKVRFWRHSAVEKASHLAVCSVTRGSVVEWLVLLFVVVVVVVVGGGGGGVIIIGNVWWLVYVFFHFFFFFFFALLFLMYLLHVVSFFFSHFLCPIKVVSLLISISIFTRFFSLLIHLDHTNLT